MLLHDFFDVSGNRINPDLYPKPMLCLSCKKNEIENEEEEILCYLTRIEQISVSDFVCPAYEEITIQ
jgi:hypothetical protein